jgi:acyl carrier protein phosphodiesterase
VLHKANKNIIYALFPWQQRPLFIINLINFTPSQKAMNFLAHAYLSGGDDQIMIGNFIADAVKGNAFNKFPESIQQGIMLHRMIDEYTDNHETFRSSKKRLQGKYDKFSGVIVDIYYDHFLARDWSNYSGETLESFVSHAYRVLIGNYSVLPARSKRILPFMVSQNWLAGYANLKDLRQVFKGMSNRVKRYNSGMENAVSDLQENYELFHGDFKLFFPEIIEYVDKKRGCPFEKASLLR